MKRLIIAGGREFSDYPLLRSTLDHLLQNHEHITIVSGAARGADKLGEAYACERNHEIAMYPADWNTHGKSAGYKRNELMADNADWLMAFWDGQSRGTKHMIDIATRKGLQVKVHHY